MSKSKVIIEFHNPNSDEETAKYIASIFFEVSRTKFETLLKERAVNHYIEAKKEGL